MAFEILIVSGSKIIPDKLLSKVAPLLEVEEVGRIFLVANSRISHPKVVSFIPSGLFNSNTIFRELYRIFMIISVVIRHRPALLVALGLIPQGIYTNIIGTLFRVKKVFLSMGKNEFIYSTARFYNRILLKIALLADFIGTRGESSKRWLVDRGYAAQNIFVPHNLHDFDLFRPLAGSSALRYDLIYVGLLSAYKQLDLLIDIVGELQKKRPGATLLLVGDGPRKKELRERAARRGIADLVTFAGTKKFKQLPRYYNQAQVFIMTSQGEGLPMAMIEAMSCGLPVVVPADADIEEIAVNRQNSLVVLPPDQNGFVEAVTELLTDDNLYSRLKRGALGIRDEYKEKFSIAYQVESWRKVLKQLL